MLTVMILEFNFSEDNPPTEADWQKVEDHLKLVPSFSPCMTTTVDYQRDEFMDCYKHGISLLRYYLAYDENEVIQGVVPLCFYNIDSKYEFWEFTGNLSYANYVPPCPPLVFAKILNKLPAFDDEFIDPDYWKATGLNLLTSYKGGFFELPPTFDAYLNGLSYKARGNLRRNLRFNSDLHVIFGHHVCDQSLAELLPPYQQYWRERESDFQVVNSVKIVHDLKVFAKHPDRLLSMYVYQGPVLLAANYSWVDTQNRVIDMLCLRAMTPNVVERGLGIFCVLANIKQCIESGITQYTLTSGDQPYKKLFITDTQDVKRVVQGSVIDLLFGRRDFYFRGLDMSLDYIYYPTVSTLLLESADLGCDVVEHIRSSITGLEYIPCVEDMLDAWPDAYKDAVRASPSYISQRHLVFTDDPEPENLDLSVKTNEIAQIN